SERLLTEYTTVPALQRSIKERKPKPGLIFHSDGGGQYYSKEFLKLTADSKIKNSMCEMAYENPHAERINGTIKNQYLKGNNPTDLLSLKKMAGRAVFNYNNVKPHSSLNRLSPSSFENLRPAGGTSPKIDNFYSNWNSTQLKQKNYQSSESLKRVKKTVNVF